MRILTIQQPWASLIACGAKTVENRRWSTTYRGPVAIHAGKAVDQAALDDPHVGDELRAHGLADATLTTGLPAGVIVAVAALVDVHHSEGLCCVPWGFPDDSWQHLLLDRIQPLREPVPYVGQLGLREIDPKAAEAVWGDILSAL